MASTKEFFLNVTQRLFSNWTALRLAVEHGMGSKERASEFCSYVTEILYMNEKLCADEIADELEDYMDAQFSTEMEDGSATQVANELLRFHGYCIKGEEAVAMEELSKQPPLQSWIVTRESIKEQKVQVASAIDDSTSNSDEEKDQKMDTLDEEWVEVKTRRKK